MNNKKNTINIVTMGCSKNRVDSEHLLRQASEAGYNVVFDSEPSKGSIAIINTCGFIGDAKEESVETILEFVNAKKKGIIQSLYVMGCLSERYKTELMQEIPEVDQYFGARSILEVLEGLKITHRPELDDERHLTTPPHYAYLKISEGCDRNCSYCAIPAIRGKHISVPMELLISEAKKLALKGVKELLVVAQDTTYYGLDLYGERRISQLLKELAKIDGIEWIRLHYAYPAAFPSDLIEVMKNEPKICKYIDIPLQHSTDKQLKLMRRGHSAQKSQDIIDSLRKAMPDIAIRTTLIAGHCSESEEDFEALKEFVAKNKFERLGVFPYSEEEGTYSAKKLIDDVPQEIKEARAEELMALQAHISYQNNQKFIGKTLKVIIDREEGDYYICRSEYDSPEVDQELLLESEQELEIGNFYFVKIYKSVEFDLYCTLI